MIFYWIITTIAIAIESWYLYKTNKLNTIIKDELVKSKNPQIVLWVITKYKEEDLKLLLSNEDIIDLLMSIFQYKIAVKTDWIRSLDDTARKVWYLDCLHEMYLFFYKMKESLKEKKEKTWNNLV
jgi:hypothetical protein